MGVSGTVCHVSNNKPKGVINAGSNIMQAQNMHQAECPSFALCSVPSSSHQTAMEGLPLRHQAAQWTRPGQVGGQEEVKGGKSRSPPH